ncbi:hypothetical protein BU26DRAFT_524400 [Trematosphaeria pertusa]|uniref:Uncharacterized protein n=1 Tax=Trematosphaeria pertusa TaxID=390896 RepID=A0A6A6HWR2_9PLEO|nr:uncharacterized protein BU26DRAFT_524400 [Trematosphaeria pertusa]KAF2242208.1 hypothetical protein BU26DRAFT_524400 [Trematosphaeria pertusa]
MKTVLKNIFKSKKKQPAKKDDATPTAPADASSSTPKPTETTPAQPAPATAPEPAKTETTPATGSAPAAPAPAPAPAPAQGEDTKPEQAALAEVKKATESRYNSNYIPERNSRSPNYWDGSRWRQRAGQSN